MRKVAGEIVLPDDAPSGQASTVTVEVRDVSVADAASSVVASKTLRNVKLAPGRRITFSFEAPEKPGRRLALRVHIAAGPARTRGVGGGGGDYLTTQSIEVTPEGDAIAIVAPVSAI